MELNTKIVGNLINRNHDHDDKQNIKLYISKDSFKIYPFYFDDINVDDINVIKKLNNEMKNWK